MTKISKHYRVNPQQLEQLEHVKKHLQDRYTTLADTLGTPVNKAKDIDALEFAIKFTYDKLKEEGYIK